MNTCRIIQLLVVFSIGQSWAEDFECPGDGYFADPTNCIKYYHCYNGVVEQHITCDVGGGLQELYDDEHNWCNFPEKVDCGDRPICDKYDENCHDQAQTTVKPTEKPDFECPAEDGFFADPKNCIKYYHCFEGIAEEHITCPHDAAGKQELYDPEHTWCDHPERVDCGDRPICDKNDENCVGPDDKTTTPNPDFDCPAPSGFFPDPKNCIKYYHCYEGVVEEHKTCPKVNGKQECYDINNSWCDWPERVDCGDRPICDENDENCDERTTHEPGPTTSETPDRCAVYGPCVSDGMGPYKAEGPCEQCFCQCVLSGRYQEVCCEPGLVFNEKITQCDWPFNIPECQ